MLNWDWNFFTKTEFEGGPAYWELFVDAWITTFEIAILSWLLAVIVGIFIGTFRTLPPTNMRYRALNMLGNFWVDIFRNIPILVQLFLWLYVVPALIPSLGFLRMHQFALAVCGLGIFTSTRIAEQITAGIRSIPTGKYYAALSLGLSTRQSYNYVLLPIATRIIMPPMISEAMNIVKNTAAVIVLTAVPSLMLFATNVAGNNEPDIFQIYMTVTIAYVITSILFNFAMRLLEKRLQVPGFAAGPTGGK